MEKQIVAKRIKWLLSTMKPPATVSSIMGKVAARKAIIEKQGLIKKQV